MDNKLNISLSLLVSFFLSFFVTSSLSIVKLQKQLISQQKDIDAQYQLVYVVQDFLCEKIKDQNDQMKSALTYYVNRETYYNDWRRLANDRVYKDKKFLSVIQNHLYLLAEQQNMYFTNIPVSHELILAPKDIPFAPPRNAIFTNTRD